MENLYSLCNKSFSIMVLVKIVEYIEIWAMH